MPLKTISKFHEINEQQINENNDNITENSTKQSKNVKLSNIKEDTKTFVDIDSDGKNRFTEEKLNEEFNFNNYINKDITGNNI